MRLQSLLRPLLATGEWRGDSLVSSSSSYSSFLLRGPSRQQTLWTRVIRVYILILRIPCQPGDRVRGRERETAERKGNTYLCGYVRAKQEGPEIKHEKSIIEEKRGDVFRPNYVPPLAACCCRGCCRGCCGNGTARRQGAVNIRQ